MNNPRKKIIITGAGGQLGSCLKKLSERYTEDFQFHFLSSQDLDITDESAVEECFESLRPDFCINAAAYTAVDLAETEKEKAFEINATAVGYLARYTKKYNTGFLHISTDYVFDGETNISYDEDNFTSPIGVYGNSKRAGEELALEENPKTIIIRTSWLYSEFGKNFVKTMFNLFKTKDELNVVSDQFGQPTNANDLAEAIMEIIKNPNKTFGVFHFSNYPETTWFHFAKKIASFSGNNIKINPIPTEKYPTPAKRPKRSTMCLDKIENLYKIELKHWENSLEECVKILKTENS